MITARADVIGSLLRPQELLHAREARAAGRLSQNELKGVEDRAVDEAVALQEGVGLELVTDGEMRRSSFQSQMTDAVSGFAEHGLDAFLWGKWRSNELEDWNVERPELAVVSKLERHRSLSGNELVYLSARAKATPKITLPAQRFSSTSGRLKRRAASTRPSTPICPMSSRSCAKK
jgi:5-methyltetrahydropteroyltriglutamate--homocysteine methyltransferase